MRILALDTSTEYLSVAVLAGERVVSRDLHAVQQHSELAARSIAECLDEAGVALGGLDAIAFGQGPGTFTGLRIACGLAQGLAFGAGLPVIPVPTLLALAHGSGGTRVIVCMDARMGEVYHAAYVRDGEDWREVSVPRLTRPEEAPSLPPSSGGEWVGVGSGFSLHFDALEARYRGRLARVDGTLHPHAADIARLAARRLARGETVPAEAAAPLYLRDKVALKTCER